MKQPDKNVIKVTTITDRVVLSIMRKKDEWLEVKKKQTKNVSEIEKMKKSEIKTWK